MSRLLTFILFSFALCIGAPAQRPNIDSLESVLASAKTDTMRARLLNELSSAYTTNNPKKAEQYANEALSIAVKTGDREEESGAYNNLASIYRGSGDYEKAMNYFDKAGKIAEEIKNMRRFALALTGKGVISYYTGNYDEAIPNLERATQIFDSIGDKAKLSSVHVNMGLVYQGKSDYEKSLYHYFQSAKLKEELRDKKGLAGVYSNIGNLYAEQKNTKAAIEYFQRSIKISEESGDKKALARALGNIGHIYYIRNEYDKAFQYNEQSLMLNMALDDKKGTTSALSNHGHIAKAMGKYEEALGYHSRSLKLEEEVGDQEGIADTYTAMGIIYKEMKRYPEALATLEKSLEIARAIGAREIEKVSLEELAEVYALNKDYDKAYEYYKLFTEVKDSLLNLENSKNIAKIQAQFESEKKDQEIVLLSKDKEIQTANYNKQKSITWSVIGGLGLVSLLAFFIFRGYRQKQKDNLLLESAYRIIEEKNRIVEEKNKDITDSINYAQRIQSAILPSMDAIKSALPDSFILYKPKDIVSGDFYWFAEKNNSILVAAADCTGHGVPGAFMSMIGTDLLNHVVMEKNITEPGEVLTYLNDGVRTALKQDVQGDATRDGMDIALVSISGKTIRFAGAYRPLWIIRKEAWEMEEIKADKFPIGGAQTTGKRTFTNHTIELDEGDTIYIFSDGYADQFGGKEGKKFMTKRMKELLLSVRHSPMNDQHAKLESSMEEWKGSAEQMDDILVIGIRI